MSLAARKKNKKWKSKEEQEKTKKQKREPLRQRLQERRLYGEMAVKSCLLKHMKDPYMEKLREAIRNRIESHTLSIVKASSGLMHLAKKIYHDVTNIKTVEFPEEFFSTKPFSSPDAWHRGSVEDR